MLLWDLDSSLSGVYGWHFTLREVVGARNSSGIPGAKKNTPPLAMSFIL
jgi:hypothetical protein